MHKKFTRGFTLIELLVVIAIIGILASVILTSLGDTRARARLASVQQTAKSIQVQGLLCIDSGVVLSAAVAGNEVCALTDGDDAVWPTLPATGEWLYIPTDDASSIAAGTFQYAIQSINDGYKIGCNQDKCVTGNDGTAIATLLL